MKGKRAKLPKLRLVPPPPPSEPPRVIAKGGNVTIATTPKGVKLTFS